MKEWLTMDSEELLERMTEEIISNPEVLEKLCCDLGLEVSYAGDGFYDVKNTGCFQQSNANKGDQI